MRNTTSLRLSEDEGFLPLRGIQKGTSATQSFPFQETQFSSLSSSPSDSGKPSARMTSLG